MTWSTKRTAKEAYAEFSKWVNRKDSAAPNPWCPKGVAGCALGYSYFAGMPRKQWQWNVDNFANVAKKNKSFSTTHGDFGDAVFFDWSGHKKGFDHIGFVIKVTRNSVKHISANSGGGLVRINTTSLKYVTGFGKPVKWAEPATPKPVTPTAPVSPQAETTTMTYINSLGRAGYKVSGGVTMAQSWAEHRARGSLGGIDWAVGQGTPIIAPTNGRVENIPNNGTGGNTVTFWHEAGGLGGGWRDQFMHLKPGGFVNPGHYKQGDVIGYSGNTGNTTGPHIHWHLIDPNGKRVPPYDYFTDEKKLAEEAAKKASVEKTAAEQKAAAEAAAKKAAEDAAAKTPVATPTPTVKKETPMRKQSKAERKAAIEAMPDVELGVIIPTAKGRKTAYAIYSLVSLVATNVAVAYASLNIDFPAWLIVSLAVIGNLATPFAALAIANAPKK